MRKHVPCTKPFPSVDVCRGEGHVTVRERTVEMKSPQDNNNQERTTHVQHSTKCFVPEERKETVQKVCLYNDRGGWQGSFLR